MLKINRVHRVTAVVNNPCRLVTLPSRLLRSTPYPEPCPGSESKYTHAVPQESVISYNSILMRPQNNRHASHTIAVEEAVRREVLCPSCDPLTPEPLRSPTASPGLAHLTTPHLLTDMHGGKSLCPPDGPARGALMGDHYQTLSLSLLVAGVHPVTPEPSSSVVGGRGRGAAPCRWTAFQGGSAAAPPQRPPR
jgi:hypothetical protein